MKIPHYLTNTCTKTWIAIQLKLSLEQYNTHRSIPSLYSFHTCWTIVTPLTTDIPLITPILPTSPLHSTTPTNPTSPPLPPSSQYIWSLYIPHFIFASGRSNCLLTEDHCPSATSKLIERTTCKYNFHFYHRLCILGATAENVATTYSVVWGWRGGGGKLGGQGKGEV